MTMPIARVPLCRLLCLVRRSISLSDGESTGKIEERPVKISKNSIFTRYLCLAWGAFQTPPEGDFDNFSDAQIRPRHVAGIVR
jgi:hypothetical protein